MDQSTRILVVERPHMIIYIGKYCGCLKLSEIVGLGVHDSRILPRFQGYPLQFRFTEIINNIIWWNQTDSYTHQNVVLGITRRAAFIETKIVDLGIVFQGQIARSSAIIVQYLYKFDFFYSKVHIVTLDTSKTLSLHRYMLKHLKLSTL